MEHIYKAVNLDGESVITFSSNDSNDKNVRVVVFHRDVDEHIEIQGIESIKKLVDFLYECFNIYTENKDGIIKKKEKIHKKHDSRGQLIKMCD